MHPFMQAIAFAQDLIRIPGPPGDERAVAERVAAELERLRFDEVFTDDVGNVIGIIRGTAGAPPVMLSSHMDVVDIGDPAGWEYPPFDAVIDGGFLHGRGAMDIKGPLAIQTYAAAHFVGRPLAGDVIVAHTVLEERGGWGMEHLMARTAAGDSGITRPGAVIIGEATNGDICVGHRGRAELIIDVIGKAGHASAPERARNPLDVLPQLLPALQSFAATLDTVDPLLGRSTAVPTAIETLPRSRNVIPDVARVVLDWRVLPAITADTAVGMLRDHLAHTLDIPDGFTLDVRYSIEPQHTYTGRTRDRRMFTPGFLLDPQHAVVRAALAAVTAGGAAGAAVTSSASDAASVPSVTSRASDATSVPSVTSRASDAASVAPPTVRPWTFATDGGHTCGVHGIPTIGYAPGEERYAHTNIERLDLAQAEHTYAVYPSLIRAVADSIGNG